MKQELLVMDHEVPALNSHFPDLDIEVHFDLLLLVIIIDRVLNLENNRLLKVL
jgi:hypothetical protein